MTDEPNTQAAAEEAAAQEPVASQEPTEGPAEPQADGADAPAAEAAPEPEPEPDWHDKYVRAVAELDNVRKRARRDVAAAEARGIGRLAKAMLPALDDLDRALAHAEAEEGDSDHHLTKGIRLVQQQLLASLQQIGIQPDSPKGERFDPHRHEAVAQVPGAEGVESGTVLEVYQPGYVYAGTVLRAAKVVVSA
jgi:molecular chaperone GrpE